MKNFWTLLVVIVLAAAVIWLGKGVVPPPAPAASSSGNYGYHCDNGAEFTMTPSEDGNSLHIGPVNGAGYPPAAVLARTPSSNGARFEGNGMIFSARGETVWLTSGSSTIACSPEQVANEAPYNFGD